MPDRRRPDPQQGVFETLLVLEGRPVDFDTHLARLHASLEALYPDREPPAVDVPEVALGAMRMTVAPEADGGLRAQTSVRELEPGLAFDPPPVALGSFTLRGGLGAHKWADRSLLEAAQIELGPDRLPLVVDEDGAVLEGSRANLFSVRDGVLSTPPLDGRILPGITRMRVLGLAREVGLDTREAPLSRDDLLAAEEVFLTGSVRGIERARTLDGAALGAGTEIGRGLSERLRRTWRAVPVG